MDKDTFLIGLTLFSAMLLLVITVTIVLSFVPEEVKHKPCIRIELRYSNLYCVTEDD